jgi:hypothetical protein
MIVHSDSFLGVMFIILVFLGTGLSLLATLILILAFRFRLASKVFLTTVSALLVFVVLQSTMLALTPQTVVKRGDSYCYDIWCIGVTDVKSTPSVNDVLYNVGVHVFSDAGRGGTIHAKKRLFLVDDHDRRFALIPDPSVIPFTRELAPQEGIDTTLTFVVPADARQLYLTTESTETRSFVFRFFTGGWLANNFSFMRKPELLRVL